MRLRLLIALMCAMLIAAACGGDDGGETSSDGDSADVASDASGDDAEDAAGDDSSDAGDDSGDDAGDDAGDDSGGDDSGDPVDLGNFDLEDLCTGDLNAAMAAAAAFGGFDPTSAGDMDTAADFFDQLAASAPDEISDDFAVLAEAVRKLADIYGDIDFSDPSAFADPELLAGFEEAFSDFDDEALTVASDNIDAWVAENCTPFE